MREFARHCRGGNGGEEMVWGIAGSGVGECNEKEMDYLPDKSVYKM
jgi:hypothetical protein